jgi:hypothetical protein
MVTETKSALTGSTSSIRQTKHLLGIWQPFQRSRGDTLGTAISVTRTSDIFIFADFIDFMVRVPITKSRKATIVNNTHVQPAQQHPAVRKQSSRSVEVHKSKKRQTRRIALGEGSKHRATQECGDSFK